MKRTYRGQATNHRKIPRIPSRYRGQETSPVKGAPGLFTIEGDENLQGVAGKGMIRQLRFTPTDCGPLRGLESGTGFYARGVFSPGGASYSRRMAKAKAFAREYGWSLLMSSIRPDRIYWMDGDHRLRTKSLKGTPIMVELKYCEFEGDDRSSLDAKGRIVE